MFDTALNDQFPAGAAAYAAYVDGGIGNQPNYAYIVSAFPKAQHLSIALFASDNADALDVEPGASAPSDIPGWYARQVARGIRRPVVYASASAMNGDVLPVLSRAGIGRASMAFNNPSKTGVVSVRRNDAGTQAVGYVIY
jgi:hypothetical protein